MHIWCVYTDDNLYLIKVKGNKRGMFQLGEMHLFHLDLLHLRIFESLAKFIYIFLSWVSSEMKRDETENKNAQCQSVVWAISIILRELVYVKKHRCDLLENTLYILKCISLSWTVFFIIQIRQNILINIRERVIDKYAGKNTTSLYLSL